MRRLLLGVALGSSLTAAACGLGPTDPDRATPTPRGSIGWAPCGDGLACATLPVPIDHTDPDGPTVDLALAVRPAARTEDRLGVLLTNPGGPGASGIDTLRSGLPLAADVLDRYDVVSWDPRGSGQSGDLDCGADLDSFLGLDPLADAADRAELDRLAPVVAQACRRGSGDLTAHLATDDQVEDMEAVRAATGEDTISYLGFSYGTRLGLDYLGRHGPHVTTMVLDSIVRPDLRLAELLPAQAQVFQRFAEDLLHHHESTFTTVRREAAAGRVDGIDGPLDPVRVDRALVLAGYDPARSEGFLEALTEAAQGDGRALDEQGRRYEEQVDFPAYLATNCADGAGPAGEAGWDDLERQVGRIAPLVGAVVVNELRPCAFWPSAGRAAPPSVPAGTDATVLLLNNTGDPATPVAWARSVADALPSAMLVEVDADGHITLDGSDCSRELAGRILTGEGRPDDPGCP